MDLREIAVILNSLEGGQYQKVNRFFSALVAEGVEEYKAAVAEVSQVNVGLVREYFHDPQTIISLGKSISKATGAVDKRFDNYMKQYNLTS